jgi:hypothetical protein
VNEWLSHRITVPYTYRGIEWMGSVHLLLGINIVLKISFSGMFFTEARVMSSTLMHEVQNNIKDALLFIAPF